MKFSKSRGFTLIEILVVSAIITVLVSLGLLMGFDVYRGSSFHSEVSLVSSLLMKARSKSLANLNQVPHGLHFDSDGYTLIPENELISKSPTVEVSASQADIVFDQLNGDTNEAEVTIKDKNSAREVTIYINEEGRINW